MKENTIRLAAIMIGALLLGSNVAAKEYFKWVDEHGVTHYGEEPPVQEVEHTALSFPDQYVTSSPDEDYYSIQNQLDRTLDRKEQVARQRAIRAAANNTQSVSPEFVDPGFIDQGFIDDRSVFLGFNRRGGFVDKGFKKDKFFNKGFKQSPVGFSGRRSGTRIGNKLRSQGVIPDRAGSSFRGGFAQRSGGGIRSR